MTTSLPSSIYALFWIGNIGFYIYALGIFNSIRIDLTLPIIILAFSKIALSIKKNTKYNLKKLKTIEAILLLLIIFQLTINFVGVLAPEISFDALWYHFPEAQVYATTGQIASIKELLYSTMPRLGEMYFTLAFLYQGIFLAKLISFTFSLLYILLSYRIARSALPRPFAMLTTATISSFIVLAWQSSSGYVDIPRAVFELGSLLCLLNLALFPKHNHSKQLVLAGILTGLALSTKMQSIISLIASLAFIISFSSGGGKNKLNSIKTTIQQLTLYLIPTLLIALPWYLDNLLSSGHILYPLNLSAKLTDQINYAGASTLSDWVIFRITRLPLIFFDLTLKGSGMLAPIILILLPIVFLKIKLVIKHHLPLLLYTLTFLALWWFIPPPETRYTLASIPPLITLQIFSVKHLTKKYQSIKKISIIFTFISIFINILIRIGATTKYLPLLLGTQTKLEYIESQTTDFNRDITDKFYSGHWKNYQYPK